VHHPLTKRCGFSVVRFRRRHRVAPQIDEFCKCRRTGRGRRPRRCRRPGSTRVDLAGPQMRLDGLAIAAQLAPRRLASRRAKRSSRKAFAPRWRGDTSSCVRTPTLPSRLAGERAEAPCRSDVILAPRDGRPGRGYRPVGADALVGIAPEEMHVGVFGEISQAAVEPPPSDRIWIGLLHGWAEYAHPSAGRTSSEVRATRAVHMRLQDRSTSFVNDLESSSCPLEAFRGVSAASGRAIKLMQMRPPRVVEAPRSSSQAAQG